MRRGLFISLTVFIAATVLMASVPPSKETSPMQWVPAPGLQSRNVVAGAEGGQPLHVCRAAHRGGVHPGKVVAGKCNIGWGGSEVVIPSYEVLVGDGQWSGRASAGAFAAGQENGAPLTLCRGRFRDSFHPGKVIGGKCNIGWGGEEKALPEYEVFVPARRSQNSNEAVQLVIRNGSNAPVDLFWIDHNGEAQAYGALAPGEQRLQPTFRSHPWIMKRGAAIVATYISVADARQFFGFNAAPRVSNVDAGPIWSQSDAEAKCPAVCDRRAAVWTKQWRTTVEGQMSVCECRGFD